MKTRECIEKAAAAHGWTVHGYTEELFAERGDRRVVVLFTRAGAVSSFMVNGRGFPNRRYASKRERVIAELSKA